MRYKKWLEHISVCGIIPLGLKTFLTVNFAPWDVIVVNYGWDKAHQCHLTEIQLYFFLPPDNWQDS